MEWGPRIAMRNWKVLLTGTAIGATTATLVFTALIGSVSYVEKFQPLIAATFALFAGYLAYSSNIENIRLQEKARRIENRAKYIIPIETIEFCARKISDLAEQIQEWDFQNTAQIIERCDMIESNFLSIAKDYENCSAIMGRGASNQIYEIMTKCRSVKLHVASLDINDETRDRIPAGIVRGGAEIRRAAEMLLRQAKAAIDGLFEE
jgi:hypothetical protein